MESATLPDIISKHLINMDSTKESIGCSQAEIYRFVNSDKNLYLKIEKMNPQSTHEQKIMHWLQGRLPVPKIIAQSQEAGYDYLLMTEAIGEMACSEKYLNKPEVLVRLLAEGIKMLQAVDISDCPFDTTLKHKLHAARDRVEKGEIDMSNWEETTQFSSPKELYDYLIVNQPEEEIVFSHGDYCLPNIFFAKGSVTGFIDLGRAGIADKWQDIALCVRSLEHNLKSKAYSELLFEYLGIQPNYEKMKYYILLDELF